MVGLVGSLWSADVVDHSWHYWCNFHFLWFKWKKGRLNKWSSTQHSHTNKHAKNVLRNDIDTVTKNWLFTCKHLQIIQRFNPCLKMHMHVYLFFNHLSCSLFVIYPPLSFPLSSSYMVNSFVKLWCYIYYMEECCQMCTHFTADHYILLIPR